MFFLGEGYRVVAHDRRGHGRSTQTDTGNDMDTYAADVPSWSTTLDLKNAIHVGHSTGGGEVAHYVARAEPGRVAKAVLIGAVPPVMVKTEVQSGRHCRSRCSTAIRAGARRQPRPVLPRFRRGPVLRLQPPRRAADRGLIRNWWRQGMMGSVKAHYDCVKAFSETDFTEDLKAIDVPVLVIHGEDDQVVPIADSAPLAVKLLKNGTLKTYPGLPHGMPTTHADVINARPPRLHPRRGSRRTGEATPFKSPSRFRPNDAQSPGRARVARHFF